MLKTKLRTLIYMVVFSIAVSPVARSQDNELTSPEEYAVAPASEVQSDLKFRSQRISRTELGEYVGAGHYEAYISADNWEAVAGFRQQCVSLKNKRNRTHITRMKSRDAACSIKILTDTLSKIPSKYTGRKRAYNNSWSWRGRFIPGASIVHKDKSSLSVPGAEVRFIDGVKTSIIEIPFWATIEWDAHTKLLTVLVEPVNLNPEGPFIPAPDLPWFSLDGLPMNLTATSRQRETASTEQFSIGFDFPKLSGSSKYSYDVKRWTWSTDMSFGNVFDIDLVRVSLFRENVANERFYELAIENAFSPFIEAYFDETVTSVRQEACSTEREVSVGIDVMTKDETGGFNVESRRESKCTGSGRTASAHGSVSIGTTSGHGIYASHVMTVRRKGKKKSASWTQPVFAVDLSYLIQASIEGGADSHLPVSVSSAGGIPKQPMKKRFLKKF